MKGLKKVVLGLGMIIMSLLTTQTQHISDVIVSHVAHGSYHYGGLYYILSFLYFFPSSQYRISTDSAIVLILP